MLRQRLKMTAAIAALLISGVGMTTAAGQGLSDSTIQAVVEHRLVKTGVQKKGDVTVSVDNGVVTLAGTVTSIRQKNRAEEEAKDADGVVRVENRLRIKAVDKGDQEIAEEIAKEIRSFVFYDIFDWIEIEVEQGTVTLKGWVREPWRSEDYARLAEDISGVERVNNQIEVLSNSINDDRIRIRAARAIFGHPNFRRYANRSVPPIHIIVDNGRLRLEGVVDSKVDKQLAENLVRTRTLSFEVINNLQVR